MDDGQTDLPILLHVLDRSRRCDLSRKLAAYGAIADLPLMVLELARSEGASQEQLAATLRADKAAVARSLQRLEREGYIRREDNADDKRANRVFLTEAARERVPEIRSAIAEWNERIFQDFSAQERETLLRCLRKMARRTGCRGAENL